MRTAFAKLAFAHRALWKRDETYRIAFVLGPPVLAGVLVAAALWWASIDRSALPWVSPELPDNLPQDGTPLAMAPFAPLPPIGSGGNYVGLEPGWYGDVHRVEIGPGTTAGQLPAKVVALLLPPGSLDMDRIIAAAPSNALSTAVVQTVMIVPEAGRYQMSMQLHRVSDQIADCHMRLGLGQRHVLAQAQVDLQGVTKIVYNPVTFDLPPGYYTVTMAFGCWRNGRNVGAGELTLMLRRPGEPALTPARADEIWRPVKRAG